MPVYRWTFDGTLRKHLIEIEHITSSGRLKLFLNREELLVQEGVKEQGWKHFFYIDGDLVVVQVIHKEGRYEYDFHEDERHESKRIRRHRRHIRNQFAKYVLLAAAFILLIGLVPYLIFNETEWYRNVRLNRGEGRLVPMTLYWDEVSGSRPLLTYVYSFEGQRHYGMIDTATRSTFRTPDGMPVWNRDEFQVRLLSDHPTSHVVELSEESWATRQRYRERVSETMQAVVARLNFVNHDRQYYLHCLLEYVREHYGIQGWAHIYFRDERGHDKEYESIIGSEGYKARQDACYELSRDTTASET